MMLERQVEVRHAVGTSIERRHDARVAVKLAVCRALTAVLCAPLVLLALASLPPSSCKRVSRADAAGMLVRKYAFEAFPQWAAVNHVQACPQTIDELTPFASNKARDPWGTTLELRCGHGIRSYVRSAGPDLTFDTDDDISSND